MMSHLVNQIIFFSATSLFLWSCSSGDLQEAKKNCVVISSASAETHFPGVYSNLRSNTEIELRIKKSCKEKIQLEYILIDDILIGINSVKQDSSWITSEFEFDGVSELLVVRGNKNDYNEEAPVTYEKVEYMKSGRVLDGQVALMYKLNGQSVTTEVQTLVRKKEVIHN